MVFIAYLRYGDARVVGRRQVSDETSILKTSREIGKALVSRLNLEFQRSFTAKMVSRLKQYVNMTVMVQ